MIMNNIGKKTKYWHISNIKIEKNNDSKTFDSMIMLRYGKTKVVKKEFYGVKKGKKIWDVDVDNFKYLIGYLDEV